MDPINPQPAQSPSNQPAPMQAAPEHKKVGPIIAILVIVLVLIIGALYLFASRINQEQAPIEQSVATENAQSVQQAATTQTTVQPVTNKDDNLGSLQNDLNVSTQGIEGQNF